MRVSRITDGLCENDGRHHHIILFYINISYNSIHHFGTGTGSVIPSHSCYSTRSTRNSLPSISGLYFLCCYPPLLPPLSLPRMAVGHNSTKNTGLKSMGAIFDQNTDLHFLCRFIPTFAAFRQNSFSFAHRHTEVSHFIWGCGENLNFCSSPLTLIFQIVYFNKT